MDEFDPDRSSSGATVPTSEIRNDRLEDYRYCSSCGAEGLENLQIGGDGRWEDKIQCLRCFEVRQVNHSGVIIPLMQEKYGFTEDQARKLEEKRRNRYREATS